MQLGRLELRSAVYIHRLRANFAQNKYQDFLHRGMNEPEARLKVSELPGHGRIDVTYKYVPQNF